jgi:hypothetical protein
MQLQNTLTETDWANTALPEISKRLKSAEEGAKRLHADIQKFDMRSKDQLERFQTLKHSSVKRAWYKTTGKLETKIQEEEKQWLKEYERVQAAKARGVEYDQEVEEARKIHSQCVKAKEAHDKAKRDLEALLEQLFAGPTPSYPTEDECEQNLGEARARLDNIRMLAKREQTITNNLQRAHTCLIAAIQELQDALQMNTFDMFSRGGYADWAVHSSLANARNLAARAQFLVTEVRRLEPNLPHIGDIHIEQDNLVFNIVFDNIFTDLRMRQLIQESYQKVHRATMILQNSILPESTVRLQAAQAQVESCEVEIKRLEQLTWNERVRIISEVIGSPMVAQGQDREPPPPQVFPREVPEPLLSVPEGDDEPPPPYSVANERRR